MRPLLAAAAAVLVVGALSACGPSAPDDVTSPSVSPTPSSLGEPTPSGGPEEPSFTAPTSCTELVSVELENQILATGAVLFSSSDGSGIYYPIASTQDGGDPFSCWYGKDGVDLSSVEFAAQPISSTDEHEGIMAVLGSGGFDVEVNGDVVTFVQVGDEGTTPAIVHIVQPDSWITGYSSFGGAERANGLRATLELIAAHLSS